MFARLTVLAMAFPLLAQSGCEQQWAGVFSSVIQSLATTLVYVLVNALVGIIFPTGV